MKSVPHVVSPLKGDVCSNLRDAIVENLNKIADFAHYMLKNEFKRVPEGLKIEHYKKICQLVQSSLVDCQYLP
jgi:hypothetical protein